MDPLYEKITANLKEVGLDGWLENWDIRNIVEAVASIPRGGVYLEVGVAHGTSLALARLGAVEGVRVIGVDKIDWLDRDDKVLAFLQKFGRSSADCEFIYEDSQRQAKIGLPIDVLFIDGDHTYEGVLRDIASWVGWVKSGGMIMFDDYNDVTGVKRAVNEIILNHRQFREFTIDGELFRCRRV